MKKKLAMFLAVSMTASLAACGSSGSSAQTTSAQTTSAQTTDSETDTSIVEMAQEAASAEAAVEAGDSLSAKDSLKGVSLTCGTTALFAPFTYYDTDGKTLVGFDLDYMKALQDYLGFTIDGDIQVMNYSAIATSLASGKLDMGMAALCATEERKAVMNFSNTYYDTGQVVMVNSETSPAEITGPDVLTSGSYTVGVEKGTASHLYAQANFPENCIQVYDTITLAYTALEQGQIDCLLQDDANAVYYTKTTPDTKLKIVGDIFNRGQSPYAVALSFDICERYPEIVDSFNAAIDALNENGTYDEIYDKWLK